MQTKSCTRAMTQISTLLCKFSTENKLQMSLGQQLIWLKQGHSNLLPASPQAAWEASSELCPCTCSSHSSSPNPRVNEIVPFLTHGVLNPHFRMQCICKKTIIFSADHKIRATKPKSFWRKEGYAVWIIKTLLATMHWSVHGAYLVLQSTPGPARILTQQESYDEANTGKH